MTALRHLQDLQAEGKIINIGLCNFDTIRTDEICTSLGPGSIVSNQIQVRSQAAFDRSCELTWHFTVFSDRYKAASRHVGRV